MSSNDASTLTSSASDPPNATARPRLRPVHGRLHADLAPPAGRDRSGRLDRPPLPVNGCRTVPAPPPQPDV